jgi:hypothetical protein
MLRSFGFGHSGELLTGGVCALTVLRHVLGRVMSRRGYHAVVRLLLARPLWWLGAYLLSMPDAQSRYAEFQVKALKKWEDVLLDRDR